jgi:hypothetical protein
MSDNDPDKWPISVYFCFNSASFLFLLLIWVVHYLTGGFLFLMKLQESHSCYFVTFTKYKKGKEKERKKAKLCIYSICKFLCFGIPLCIMIENQFFLSLFLKFLFSLFDIVILKFTQLLFHLFFCKKDPRLAWAMQKTRLMSWVEILGFFFLSLVKVSSGLQWLFYWIWCESVTQIIIVYMSLSDKTVFLRLWS